ncbi:MAG: FGGY-family carbohydrate kinase, partial [Deltaproteobacteria bacterium]|nr:FGGY-family carbohydrate kinase [Deltaproteobacteria bacterium]
MGDRDLILAIDNGTQSIKTLVFDREGNLVAGKSIPFSPPYHSRHPGWAEQDPEVFWKGLCRACKSLWQEEPQLKERLVGVAITTQRGTVINVDAGGRPLRPAIHWLDQRKTYRQLPIGGLWGILFSLIGMRDTIAYFQAEAEANWIRTYEPEVWKKTHKYLLLSGYLTFRLTGEFVDSIGCQVGYIPFDYKHLRWASSWDWKWRVLPMDPALLPDLITPSLPLGNITKEASRDTGIPRGLPLIAAAADKACEVIGSGSLSLSVGCLSYGTTATINVTSKNYVEAIPLLPPYPSAVPGYHTIEVQIYRGFWMVSWFKKEFGQEEERRASECGLPAEELLEELAAKIPPGSLGLVL